MHARRPASGHQQGVARDGALTVRQLDRRDALAARGAGDLRAGFDWNAGGANGLDGIALRLWPPIEHSGDSDAGTMQVQRGAVGTVVVGRHDDRPADGDAPAGGEGAGGVGQHDAGAVVVRKRQRTLDGAGRQHDFAGAHLPEAFARGRRIG